MENFFEKLKSVVVTMLIVLFLGAFFIMMCVSADDVKEGLNDAALDFIDKKDAEKTPKDLGLEVGTNVSETESFVGCYADTNGDGIVDGVIFADLAIGGSGSWYGDENTYSYSAVQTEKLKKYVVSQNGYEAEYDAKFGKNIVITPISEGEDRFYIMALKDVEDNDYRYSWYANAYNNGKGTMTDWRTATISRFGAGKANTAAIIEKWNAQAYGPQNNGDGRYHHGDIWGKIQEQVADGWFVPSEEEWIAFADELNITHSNYLRAYWSSTQFDQNCALLIDFDWTYRHSSSVGIWRDTVDRIEHLRLAKTF